MNASGLPQYRSHKVVSAAKILELNGQSALLAMRDANISGFLFRQAYVEKHKPEAGGYYVVYEDGYESFSPAKAFEEGYTPIKSAVPAQTSGDTAIEQEIQAKGKTAPRVTPADLQANIASEHYIPVGSALAAMGHMASYETPVATNLLTICVLVLKNGFTVTGESACASPENFDPEIGRKIARQNAEQKIWPLMGYQLKEQLYINVQPAKAA